MYGALKRKTLCNREKGKKTIRHWKGFHLSNCSYYIHGSYRISSSGGCVGIFKAVTSFLLVIQEENMIYLLCKCKFTPVAFLNVMYMFTSLKYKQYLKSKLVFFIK